MKTIMLALALAAAPLAASAQMFKEIGVGVVAGDPIGGTAKLWLDDVYAVDAGVGFSGSTVLWGDVMYHAWNLLPQPYEGRLGMYFSAGPRLEPTETEFGVRTMVGASWRLARQPLEIFAEAGPVFRMTQSGGVDADGGAGIRLYLGSAR